VIVDYGLCNLDSIRRALEECGAEAVVTDRPDDLATATHLVMPGVGAFPDGIDNLRARGLDSALTTQVRQGIPFLGICLGMQLLLASGTEVRPATGLGWFAGSVDRLPALPGERIPHVGWDEVHAQPGCPLFAGIAPGTDFYFVHSYHARCADPAAVVATTPSCGGFAAAIRDGNRFGVQFHPEKSQTAGFRLLTNFLGL